MKLKSNRLFFIDAMRAWAILMMLQGHFIDGLLNPVFRNSENPFYSIWLYFRGMTAPVFFTVSGFIFTYLLLKSSKRGTANPRVGKGIKRGIQLLLIGYVLRLNFWGLFKGEIYAGFHLVDVLHCIGLSILAIVGLYILTITRKKFIFPGLLVLTTMLLFLFEPLYGQWSFSFLPMGIANYFTKVNGSVFTIIPWLGYATLGAALSILFMRFRNFKNVYPFAILIALAIGFFLIFFSSPLFLALYKTTGLELFSLIQSNNYLFIRLGDVLVVFGIFMLARKFLIHSTLLRIGASTLSIYVMHFIILYGSFTGVGLYKFLHHELTPWSAVTGAVLFMFTCTFLAFQYNKHEIGLKEKLGYMTHIGKALLYRTLGRTLPISKNYTYRIKLFLMRFLVSPRK